MSRRKLYEDAEPDAIVVPFDVINEQVIVALAVSRDDLRAKLVRQCPPEHFHSDKHERAWREVVMVMAERGLQYDAQLVATLCDADLAEYVAGLVAQAGNGRNVDQHVERLRWDAARMAAAKGPLPRLLNALKDPRADPGKLLEDAREVGACFQGHGDTTAMPAPGTTADEQAVEIRLRMAGKASYPCGIADLDRCKDGSARLVPGLAPKRCTWITGVSGSGKSTVGRLLARSLALAYVEGDELHPARNVALMAAGIVFLFLFRRGLLRRGLAEYASLGASLFAFFGFERKGRLRKK